MKRSTLFLVLMISVLSLAVMVAVSSELVYAAGSLAGDPIDVDDPTIDFTWAHINDATERVTITANGTDSDCEQEGTIDWDLTVWSHGDVGELTDSSGRQAKWKATSTTPAPIKCKLDDSYEHVNYNDDLSGWSATVTVKGFYVGVKMDVTPPSGVVHSQVVMETAATGATSVSNNSCGVSFIEAESPNPNPETRLNNIKNTAKWTYITSPEGAVIQDWIRAAIGHSYTGSIQGSTTDEDIDGHSTASISINLAPLTITHSTTAPRFICVGAAVAAGFEGTTLGGSDNAEIELTGDDAAGPIVPSMNPKLVDPPAKPGVVEEAKWEIVSRITVREDWTQPDAYGWVTSTIQDTWSAGVPSYVGTGP